MIFIANVKLIQITQRTWVCCNLVSTFRGTCCLIFVIILHFSDAELMDFTWICFTGRLSLDFYILLYKDLRWTNLCALNWTKVLLLITIIHSYLLLYLHITRRVGGIPKLLLSTVCSQYQTCLTTCYKIVAFLHTTAHTHCSYSVWDSCVFRFYQLCK